jgi:Sec23/Sec24 trunk domain
VQVYVLLLHSGCFEGTTLDIFPGGERARVGIATFDSAVQFYALRPGQSAPQMLVVPDISEPYAPSASSLLVNARKARSLVSMCLCQSLCIASVWMMYRVSVQSP